MNNFLKAVFFDHPDYIPVSFCISGAFPDGGLAPVYGLHPGVPVENINTLMDALEKYMLCY